MRNRKQALIAIVLLALGLVVNAIAFGTKPAEPWYTILLTTAMLLIAAGCIWLFVLFFTFVIKGRG